MTRQRLRAALTSYAGLAVIALALLRGRFLAVVLIFLLGLAVKSWVVYKKEQL